MNIAQLKDLIKDKPDTEQIFVAVYDRNEAEEHIENNLMCDDCAGDNATHKIPDDKWGEIVNSMNTDDGIWESISEAFNYYVEKYYNAIEKGNHEHSN